MQVQSSRSDGGPAQIRAFLEARGFHSCDRDEDIHEFRDLAQRLLPVAVASFETLKAVQGRTGHSLFLRKIKDASGFIAFFPLSPLGERALIGPTRSALNADWVRPFGPDTRTGYVWGLGGETRSAHFAVLRALAAMRSRFFADVGLYARATTPEGRRVMAGFGYDTPIDEGAGLYFAAPLGGPRLAVAS